MNDTTTNGTDCPADYWDEHCSRCSDELEGGRDATLCKECSREIEMKRRERGDRCERCDGHGYIYGTICDLQRAANGRDTLCPECHGSGRVPYEPDDGRLVPDGGQVEDGTERCPVCGEPAERLPEDLRGRYETPDGETYWGHSGDYLHRDCAELTIEQIESGQEQMTLVPDGGTVEDVTYHSATCDECGNRTLATDRQLLTGVKCIDCQEVPNWP